ncbi:response regulator transcription factor [bacterium SCSIO 12696]|nr:response regulator transcription factor [bacterium SCSIO 12696]
MGQHILIVDDDTELCDMVSDYLTLEGFATTCVNDGEQGAQMGCSGHFDAVVLDVMLPKMNGFDVLRQVRARSRLPVLMLTARGEEIDRIVGLEMGADDYLPKPFSPRELTARLRAILRRMDRSADNQQECTFAGLCLQPGSRQATLNGMALELTSSEYNILYTLISRAAEVVTKELISSEALGKPLARYDRSIDMHISHLRRKLSSGSSQGPTIETIRGIGYQLIEAK